VAFADGQRYVSPRFSIPSARGSPGLSKRLGALASVDDHLDQIEVVELGVFG
jgi:hypothetical protein